jgi:asparagine synthase (glutamine-hydrolysing)
MCGICGIVSFTSEDVPRGALERMCGALVHRGPDDEGIHVAGPAGLAQRRLSIIDLSAGAVAPLSNEDGTVWVTQNGEIYNFQELRAELEEKGHVFRTSTDTEVIVHLYEQHGLDCVSRLRGMFAFAIWDASKQRLMIARDRLGKKPVLYTKTPGRFIFASSIAALLENTDVSAAPNYRALDDFLAYQYVPSPETAFAGIHKLPPGHFLTCSADGGIEVRRYWRPPLAKAATSPPPDSRDLEIELRERLREAVRMRMIADVPLGAFLSGGVDSSAVVALMAQASDRPVKTFSIGFEERDFDELPFARRLSQQYGTDHHEFIVRPDATSILHELVWHYGEPFADSSALPTYYLSRLTREHVTVALSGDGGDENFAGYDNYRIVAAWNQADMLPVAARRAVQAGVDGVLQRLPYHPTAARVGRASAMLASDLSERFRLQSSVLKPEEKRAAYTPRFRALLADAGRAPRGPASLPEDPEADPLDWMAWHDLQFYLPDCLMVKVDVASMANSLEVRAPLLDHEFVEFAATIPVALKRDATGGKIILKRALAGLVPAETLERPKKGFGVPLRRWFGGDLLDLVRGTLLDERARRRDLFEPGLLRQLVDDHAAGRHDWSHRLWALVWLELWFREFID